MRRLFFVLWFAICLCNTRSYATEMQSLKILRDDEIENVLRDLSKPIISAAQMKHSDIEFVLIDNVQENAFVIGGKVIFLHSGLLIKNINNPEAIAGVIAHELGHLMAKHNITSQMHNANASQNMIYGSILGLAAMTAGMPELGAFFSLGGHNATFLTMMKYSRQHEAEADKISSKLLTNSGIGTKGLLKFLSSLREREHYLSSNPYYLTHPLSKDRIAFLRNYTSAEQFYSDQFIKLYQRAIYKLLAFTTNRVTFFTSHSINEQNSRDYANAIISFRQGRITQAIDLLNHLLIAEPENPYFLELKAQIELSNGKFLDALNNFTKAYRININNRVISAEYAFAIIKYIERNPTDKNKQLYLNEAIEILQANLHKRDDDVMTLTLLANAYFLNGMHGESRLSLAEKFYMIGDNDKALAELKKAMQLLKAHTAAYIKAQDLKNLLCSDHETCAR
jgi:predicted Zn-dependent protease